MQLRWLALTLAFLIPAASCGQTDGGDGSDQDDGDGPMPDMGPCSADSECDGDWICQSNECVEPQCTEDADCAGGWECYSGRCYAPNDPNDWIVGDEGLVLRATLSGHVEPHEVGTTQRLQAIACLGTEQAWIVGRAGTALATTDGGTSWAAITLPTTADLYAVAAAHSGKVVLAGDDLLLWSDDGQQFEALALEVGPLRGVATDGSTVLAVGLAGRQLRWAEGELVEQTIAAVDLLDVDMAGHAATAVAVGLAGTIAWSSDHGGEWQAIEAPTSADLWAVQVASDGHAAFAVGDDGVLVRVSPGAAEATVVSEADLRGLHINAAGHGAIVGTGGTLLRTTDFAESFTTTEVGVLDLLGVDAIGEHHW
jgi:photosystem II stability/assembly factor-like uncharacterized protein